MVKQDGNQGVGRLGADAPTALAPPSGVKPASGLEQSRSSHGAELPDDVRRLVIAARVVAFGPIADSVRHEPEFREQMKELDTASEAFAARVPWEMD